MNELPYKRTKKKGPISKKTKTDEQELNYQDLVSIKDVVPDRIVTTKRLINAYNAGDTGL